MSLKNLMQRITSLNGVEILDGDHVRVPAGEIRAALVEAERLRTVLEMIQFASQPNGGEPFCPECWRTRSEGHAPDCALRAALAAKE